MFLLALFGDRAAVPCVAVRLFVSLLSFCFVLNKTTALHKVCDEVIASLEKLDIHNLWESMFPDHIVTLISRIREACDRDKDSIAEEVQAKLFDIYSVWHEDQTKIL